MAKDSDHLAGAFETENTGGVLSGLLAEENEFDRSTLWRIGSWGVAAVAAVVVAVMASQTSLGWRRDQHAVADLTRQAQQLQTLTRESQNEARRLSSAIDTLNSDRDRLFSRVTVLEQGLDSATGAIARQNSAAAQPPAAPSKPTATTEAQPLAQNQATAPAVAPVTTTIAPVTTTIAPIATSVAPATTSVAPVTTSVAPAATTVLAKTDPAPRPDKPRAEAEAKEQRPTAGSPAPAALPAASSAAAERPGPATPLIAAKSIMAPPDPGAPKLLEPEKPVAAKADEPPAPDVTASAASKEPDASDGASPNVAVQRTEFAVDVGGANSIGGLRALWRGLTKSNSELAALRPIIMVKESATGLGMQLRLAAGPLADAAAAAKICAALIENQRTCEMTVFDGQRLAVNADEQPPAAKPAPPPQQHRRGYYPKRSKKDDPPPTPQTSTSTSTPTLSRLFSR
jgi:hypothetical protein